MVGGTIAALAALVGLTALLIVPTRESRSSVAYMTTSIEVPLGHLSDALEANTAAEAFLVRAAASIGEERNTLLSKSIAAGESSAKAWTSYRGTALHLKGEAQLATQYERDYAAQAAVGGSVMVPILQSNQPANLPARQLLAGEQDRADLNQLRAMYERQDASTLQALDHRLLVVKNSIEVGAVALAAAGIICAVAALRSAFRVVDDRKARAAAAHLAEFESRLIRALELADDDGHSFRVATKALTEVLPDALASVVVSDASGATFRPVVGVASCGVKNPDRCPAIQAGAPLKFHDSTSLDACPVLADTATTACSVTCMPVSVAGRDAAVVQLTGPVGAAPEMGAAVGLVVRRTGERVTMLRAFARFELQASRDPLTGLYNRRSLEAAVARLHLTDTPYAVAFADLDQFKRLNDVHGHEAGDRALRAFAHTVANSLRPEDLACRWGGEEFVIVFPGCDDRRAADAMERVRTRLLSDAIDGLTVSVTASVGVAEGGGSLSFAEAVGRADAALRVAKAGGRDQVVAWRPPSLAGVGAEPTTPVAVTRTP
ncbi:MAG: hypothetical protein JWN46_324 [Acidimicrobiales bacterium]|nr:hypothetical protein [Acidimicrobiales bacterium]